jgi:hypothetical protein
VQSVLGGLHMVTFGGLALKWVYFVCGLAGSAMMATGAILFVVKRRAKHLGEFGSATAAVYRLIEGLNVAAVAGLAVACIGFLWANRLVPLGLPHRDDWELAVFFGLWALAVLHAWARPPAAAWREQFGVLGLPVLNFMTTGDHLAAHFRDGDWESAGVELFVLATGLAAAAVVRRLYRAPAAQSRRSVSVARKAAGSIAQPESGV